MREPFTCSCGSTNVNIVSMDSVWCDDCGVIWDPDLTDGLGDMPESIKVCCWVDLRGRPYFIEATVLCQEPPELDEYKFMGHEIELTDEEDEIIEGCILDIYSKGLLKKG